MKIFSVVVILLQIELALGLQCGNIPIASAAKCPLSCLDWAKLNLVISDERSLSLANCGISLIVNISHNSKLRELNLMNNKLQHLPHNLLQHLTSLNTLNLNGNPLTAIPISVIKAINVTFDCSCDVWRNLIHKCKETENCTQSFLDTLRCSVWNDSSVLDASSFYNDECKSQSLIAVYVLVPLFIVVIAGASVLVLMKRCSKPSSPNPISPNKQQSISSMDHMQQRYASATNWKDAARQPAGLESSREAKQQQLVHKDYENMFMGESDGAQGRCDRKQQIADDTYYLESDPAGDIYLNEQPIYCNYTGGAATPEDDVYILPDK
ncbi:uncharacterized protein [Heptranchias perlo]|uniref:uncharacterized protein n=1 Tax=Heptranchias perlo TaxID=212740 RepID=UPI00355A65D6